MVVLVGLTAAVVLGRIPAGWSSAASSHRHEALPEDDLRPEDLRELRFDQGLRGYRMDQVDAVLERLGEELADRDRQIASLRPAREHRAPADDRETTDGAAADRARADGAADADGHED